MCIILINLKVMFIDFTSQIIIGRLGSSMKEEFPKLIGLNPAWDSKSHPPNQRIRLSQEEVIVFDQSHLTENKVV